MKRVIVAAASIIATAAAIAQENPSLEPVSAEAAEEINKAVTTHVKVSAKSKVSDDIKAYCNEATPKIVIGAPRQDGSVYLSGVERVTANASSPNFIRSRMMAYTKAYQKAVAGYVMNKFGIETVKQFNTYFKDQSSDRLQPSADAKTTIERIAEKAEQLTEAKLDEGLRAMGVTPSGSIAQKRKLAEDSIASRSLRTAVGSSAGLLPVQTFEGWDDAGKYAVGVVIRGGVDTETIAECLRNKTRPVLSRPEAGLKVEDALPTDDELVSQFGVRLFFDEKGVPALLSFAQWGSAYTGTDEDEAEDALDHAMIQAEALANEQLTTFINSTITVRDSSAKGESKITHALFDANGVPSEEKVVNYLDVAEKSSTITGSDTMIGRSRVIDPKVIVHPQSGQKIAVCALMWSFGQYDAMRRVIERPKPTEPGSTGGSTGTPGKRRGRSYDF